MVTGEIVQDVVRLVALLAALAIFSLGFYLTGDRDS